MLKDENKIEELKATKRILLNTFLILLLILSFNFVPQFLLNNMAKYYIKHNNYLNAEKCYKYILTYEYKIYKNINHTNPEWLNKLAEVYIKDKKYDLALSCYQQSLSIYQSKKYKKIFIDKIADNLVKIGNIYVIKQDSKNALNAYKSALILFEEKYGQESLKTVNARNKIDKLVAKN